MIKRYSLPEAEAIWTDQNRYELWLKVELAACKAMAKYKLIPKDVVQRLEKSARVDVAKIEANERVVKHDVIAFTMSIEEQVGKDAQYFHYGLTSSDVLDTAFSLQLRAATDLILKELKLLLNSMRMLAVKTKALPAIGRSHGIHAEPLAFGLRFLAFYAALERDYQRIKNAREAISVGMFSGAVGAYGTLSPKIEVEACKILGLEPEAVSTQVIPRDRHAELFSAIALMGANMERVAVELRHLQRTEVGEIEEGFDSGQKGSSAMPHKKNPISAENLTGCARLLRAWANAALENVALWHERDISHSSVERIIGPDSCILSHYMTVRLRKLIDGIQVNEKKITHNLNYTRGLVWSGAVLLAFVKAGMERDKAYRLVQKHAMEAWNGGKTLEERLCADKDALKYLSKQEIQDEFAHSRGLRFVDEIYRRVLPSRTLGKNT